MGSTATAYLHPAMSRGNLKIFINAHATRILFDRHRACGVEFARDGRLEQVQADTEVILPGSAYNSPQLLMLSGMDRRRMDLSARAASNSRMAAFRLERARRSYRSRRASSDALSFRIIASFSSPSGDAVPQRVLRRTLLRPGSWDRCSPWRWLDWRAAGARSSRLPSCSNFARLDVSELHVLDFLNLSIAEGDRIDGVLGGSGPRTKYTANCMPQIRCSRVVGVLGQNDPPTDGMSGMIEGLLGRRTGVG
jgi:hypothetical protein